MTASPPIDPSVLLALAERCEREEPSAALNFAIWEAVHATRAPVGTFEEWVAPAYATSIDAAVTLVPEGPRWGAGGNPICGAVGDVRTTAKTPALALCAAALRARAAIAELEVPIGSRILI